MVVNRVLFIDHYDSFSFNLIDWLKIDCRISDVQRVVFDHPDLLAVWARNPCPIVFGPGPRSPVDVPQSLALVQKSLFVKPILGVCLGHQILAHHLGAKIVKALDPFHGTSVLLVPTHARGWAADIPVSSREVAVYNSLVIDATTLPQGVSVVATDGTGQVMAVEISQSDRPSAWGWQFHPESFLSKCRGELAAAWRRQLARHCQGTA